jgi:hypothetical protein
VINELAATLRVPLRPDEERRRDISKRLLPHVRQFYAEEGYLAERELEPFYRLNCRH